MEGWEWIAEKLVIYVQVSLMYFMDLVKLFYNIF